MKKPIALFTSLVALSATALVTFAVPAEAAPNPCQAGCTLAAAVNNIGNNGGSADFLTAPFDYTVGLKFHVTDPGGGVVNAISFWQAASEPGPDAISLWDITTGLPKCNPCAVAPNTPGAFTGASFAPQTVVFGHEYAAAYRETTSLGYNGPGNLPASSGSLVGDNGSYTVGAGIPSTDSPNDYGVNVQYFSFPNAPTVTVTAASPTSANSSWTGDGEAGATDTITCNQAGPPAPVQHGPSPVGSGTFSNVQSGLNTNGQPVVCIGQETSNAGFTGPIGSSGNVYLPPPAPTIGTVTPNPASPSSSVLVSFTNNSVGATSPTFTATCSQSGHPNQTGTSGTSPITVNGLGGAAVVSCTVHETFAAPNGLNSVESGAATTFLPPPTPVIVSVVPTNPGQVTVTFGPVVAGETFTVVCTPVPPAQGSTVVVTGTTSPIVVSGLPTGVPIVCTVTATFGNGAGTATSGAAGTTAQATSGPGCTPAGDVAAPGKVSAAAEAFPGAQVSWAPVVTDCLVGYLVTPSTGSAVLVNGHGTTQLIHGPFAFGSTVTFTVSAVTGAGVGPASDAVSVTIGTPAAASSVHATRVAKGAIKVAFKAGSSNGAAIKKFTATCGSNSASGKSSPLVVKGLKAGKSYTCTVTATNSRGKGAAGRSNAARA